MARGGGREGGIIRGRRLIEGRLLFEEIRYFALSNFSYLTIIFVFDQGWLLHSNILRPLENNLLRISWALVWNILILMHVSVNKCRLFSSQRSDRLKVVTSVLCY